MLYVSNSLYVFIHFQMLLLFPFPSLSSLVPPYLAPLYLGPFVE